MWKIGNTKWDGKSIFNFKTEIRKPDRRKQKSLNAALGVYTFMTIISGGLTSYASESMSNNADTSNHLKVESTCHYLDPDDLVTIEGLEGSYRVLREDQTTRETYVEFRKVFDKVYRLVEGKDFNPGVDNSVKGEGNPVYIAFLDVGKDVEKGLRAYSGVVSDIYRFEGSHPRRTCQFVSIVIGNGQVAYAQIAVDTGNNNDWQAFEEIIRSNSGKVKKEQGRVVLSDGENGEKEIISGELLTLFTSPQFTKVLRPYGHPRVLAPFSEPEDEITKTARTHYQHGFLALENKDFAKAKESFDQVVQLKVNRFTSRGYLGRGTALNELGQFHEAIRDFNHVIHLDPENHEAFLLRGLAHDRSEHIEEAFKDYSAAGRLYPEDGHYDGKPQFYTFLLSARTGKYLISGRFGCVGAAKVNPEYKWCLEEMDEWTPNIPTPDSKVPLPGVFQQVDVLDVVGALGDPADLTFLNRDHTWDGVIAILGEAGPYVHPDPGKIVRDMNQEMFDTWTGMMGW